MTRFFPRTKPKWLMPTKVRKPYHHPTGARPDVGRRRRCYNARMTFMTVTYELQNALKPEQYRALGKFANTYGLQKFRFDENTNHLHFDYDASRLRETVVEHVLREAKIPVLRRVA